MKNTSVAEGHLVTNKMEINLDVFGPLMLHWIAGKVGCTDVVTIDNGCASEGAQELV